MTCEEETAMSSLEGVGLEKSHMWNSSDLSL